MRILEVQFQTWDKIYDFSAEMEETYLGATPARLGDFVVVKLDMGIELGKVVGEREEDFSALKSADEQGKTEEEAVAIKPILRRASAEDLEKARESNADKDQKMSYAYETVKKYNLPMKLVDAHVSFDGSRLTFAFIADGRIDFRELVKDLSRHFGKTVRLRQLGVRDEAQIAGDTGSCGRNLCCKSFLSSLDSVTSEFAEHQQVSHRGSDRLTGVCGRLKCCLSYEEKMYAELMSKLPSIRSRVKTPQGEGTVIGWHTLDQIVDVEIQDANSDKYTIVKVSAEDIQQ